MKNKLTPLTIPVPPQLEKALGYTGKSRWLAVWWTPFGDEVMLHDKWMTYTGEWQGFQAYVHHRAVSFALRGYHLGSSDEEAKHALIFDLRNRQAYIAAKNDAYAFIARQDEPAPDYLQQMKPPDDSVTINDLSHLFQNNIRPSLPSIDDIMADLQSYRAVVEDMLQWLDKHWSANNN